MVTSKQPVFKGIVHLQKFASILTLSYAWVFAALLALLVVLALADIFLSGLGLYLEDVPLLASQPIFQTATTWLALNMSLGFAAHYAVRPNTHIDLTLLWCLSLIGSAVLYWY